MKLEITNKQRKIILDIDNIVFSELAGTVERFFNKYVIKNYDTIVSINISQINTLIEFACYSIELENKVHNILLDISKFKEQELEISIITNNNRLNLYSVYSLLKLSKETNKISMDNWDLQIYEIICTWVIISKKDNMLPTITMDT